MSEMKTYYSVCPSLTIHPKIGTPVFENGQQIYRKDEQILAFAPIGDFGMLKTDDPDVQAFCEKHPDIIGVEEYNRRIMPDSRKAQMAEEKSRTLVEENAALRDEVERLRAQSAQNAALFEERQRMQAERKTR